MKKVNKQLYMLRQAGVEKLGRAEKSVKELPDHLNEAQRNVDYLSKDCAAISKKLSVCCQSSGPDFEKRVKKLPQMALANTYGDASQDLGDSPFGQVAALCHEAIHRVAFQQATFEQLTDQDVVSPLRSFVETDCHDLSKLYKKLEKSRLELDSTRSRVQKAEKKSQPDELKALQSQLDTAESKFISLQNQYQVDLLTTAACELDLAKYLVMNMEQMIVFHREALARLEDVVPKMKAVVDTTGYRRLFGCPLETHLAVTNREVSVVLEVCVSALLPDLETEGLFRIAGTASLIKNLKAHFDYGIIDLSDSSPHVIAGALKMYLRELPEPLMTCSRHEVWRRIGSSSCDRDARLQSLHQHIHDLPKPNFDNLRYLIVFLNLLAEHQAVNKMGPSNIALVIAPNLMWPERTGDDDKTSGASISDSQYLSRVVEDLIGYCEYFFPGGAQLSSTLLVQSQSEDSIKVEEPVAECATAKPRPAPLPRPRDRASSDAKTTLPKGKPHKKPPAPRPPGRPTSPPTPSSLSSPQSL